VDLELARSDWSRGRRRTVTVGVVYLPLDLKAQIAAQVERVRTLERQSGRMIPYLFPHLSGRHVGYPGLSQGLVDRLRERRAWLVPA